MRAVLQRVLSAHVDVDGVTVGRIARGWLVLLGAEDGDTSADAAWLVDRVGGLRAFSDAAGKMNLALADVQGALLVVSQFTLLANLQKGRRPSFERALAPDAARALYEQAVELFRARGLPVETGRFAADMQVHLVNDGPVTFVLESRQRG